MFDIKNYIEDEIFLKDIKGGSLIFYKNNKIQFYLKKCKNITRIKEYQGKKNILVKIEEEYKNFFKKLEKKFLEKKNREDKDLISLMRTNKSGTILKLKVNKKRDKTYINVYNKFKEEIIEDELEKDSNIDCLIELDRFWEYNNKIGYIVIVKKIYIK